MQVMVMRWTLIVPEMQYPSSQYISPPLLQHQSQDSDGEASSDRSVEESMDLGVSYCLSALLPDDAPPHHEDGWLSWDTPVQLVHGQHCKAVLECVIENHGSSAKDTMGGMIPPQWVVTPIIAKSLDNETP